MNDIHATTRLILALAVAGAAALGAGCGGDVDPETAAATKKSKPISVKPPEPPKAADCAPDALVTKARPDDLLPKPGVYRYSVKGERVLPDRNEAGPLPKELQLLVTPGIEVGNLRCFRAQQRFDDDLASTATFVIRGPDVYVSQLKLQEGGQIVDFNAQPPVRSFDGNNLEWSGTYTGKTSGNYAIEVMGERTLTIGGKRVKAVGIDVRVTFNGEVEGTEHARRWVSLDRAIVVAEEVDQVRKFGLDRLKLSYKTRLLSMKPEAK